MRQTFSLVADNVTPAHDGVLGCDGKPLHASIGEDTRDELPHRIESWRLEEDQVASLSRDGIQRAMETLQVRVGAGHDADAVHGYAI